ncbi:MAG: hypothetical protein JNJ89_00585 [Rubrivivax sp.]|nr:hypothetical protein [Rubrivivax sp.]
MFKPCGSGLSCHPVLQTCYHKPRHEGEPCMAGYPCGAGLTCEAFSQRCRAPGKFSDACHATRPCGAGLSCHPFLHKCYHKPRKAGEPCSAGYSCGEGLYCQSFLHKCVAKTVDYTKQTPCNALRVHATAEDAKRAGVTMTFGAGSAGGVGAFGSYETGLVYGENGQVGCYATACIGTQADISIGSYANFGLYNRFADFEGFSVVTGGGANVPFVELGFQTSQVWASKVPTSPKDFTKNQLVGTASALSFGIGLNPVNASYAMCYTEVLDDGDVLNKFAGIEGILKEWGKAGFAIAHKPARLRGASPQPAPATADMSATGMIALRSHHGLFVVAEQDGHARANRSALGPWEQWTLVRNADGTVSFRSHHGKYLVAEPDGRANANRAAIGPWEKWQMTRHADGTVSFRSHHGRYLVAESNGELNANRESIGPWQRFQLLTGR